MKLFAEVGDDKICMFGMQIRDFHQNNSSFYVF